MLTNIYNDGTEHAVSSLKTAKQNAAVMNDVNQRALNGSHHSRCEKSNHLTSKMGKQDEDEDEDEDDPVNVMSACVRVCIYMFIYMLTLFIVINLTYHSKVLMCKPKV